MLLGIVDTVTEVQYLNVSGIPASGERMMSLTHQPTEVSGVFPLCRMLAEDHILYS